MHVNMNIPRTLEYVDFTYTHRYQPGLTNVTEKMSFLSAFSPSQSLLSTPIFNSVVNPLKLLSKFNLPTVFFQPFKLSSLSTDSSFFPFPKRRLEPTFLYPQTWLTDHLVHSNHDRICCNFLKQQARPSINVEFSQRSQLGHELKWTPASRNTFIEPHILIFF